MTSQPSLARAAASHELEDGRQAHPSCTPTCR
jgi:hypothetical protein